MKSTRQRLPSGFQIIVVLVTGLLLSAISFAYSGLVEHSRAYAQSVDQTDEGDRLVLADFQQRNAGSVVTPGESCPSAKLSNPERQLESGLGQGNMALEATFDLPDNSAKCWVAILFQLESRDISDYAELVFDIKADVNEESLEAVRIEWKAKRNDASHPYDMAVYEVHDIGQDWQTVRIPLGEFGIFMQERLLEDWSDVDQLLFVIESDASSGGTLLLDNIALVADTAPPSSVPPKVLAPFEPEYGLATTESDENNVVMTIVPDTGSSSMVAMLEYTTPTDDAMFTIELDGEDMSAFDALTFYARADSKAVDATDIGFDVSISGPSEVGSAGDDSTMRTEVVLENAEWQKFELPYSIFAGDAGGDEFWANLTQLSFVFSPELSGESGTIYIDNIQLERIPNRLPNGIPVEAPAADIEEEQVVADILPENEVQEETDEPAIVQREEAGPVAAATPDEPEPIYLTVSNFDACATRDSGAAYESPTIVTDTYPEVAGRGCVLKAQVDTSTWGAYWFRLGPADLSGFSKLQFDMAFEKAEQSTRLRVEMKETPGGRPSVYYINNPSQDWETKTIPFSEFSPPLPRLSSVAELVFVLETAGGTLYLDNVRFIQ